MKTISSIKKLLSYQSRITKGRSTKYCRTKVSILKDWKKIFLSSQSIKFLKLHIQNLILEVLKEKGDKRRNFLKIETKKQKYKMKYSQIQNNLIKTCKYTLSNTLDWSKWSLEQYQSINFCFDSHWYFSNLFIIDWILNI